MFLGLLGTNLGFLFDNTATTGFKIQARHLAELEWIKKLQTAHPLGLNDHIIFIALVILIIPLISTFLIFYPSGNANVDRMVEDGTDTSNVDLEFLYLLPTYIRSSGMLDVMPSSKLSSLSITALSTLDTECNSISSNSRLYDTADHPQLYQLFSTSPY